MGMKSTPVQTTAGLTQLYRCEMCGKDDFHHYGSVQSCETWDLLQQIRNQQEHNEVRGHQWIPQGRINQRRFIWCGDQQANSLI
jgi:predicted ATP-dependent serine protease